MLPPSASQKAIWIPLVLALIFLRIVLWQKTVNTARMIATYVLVTSCILYASYNQLAIHRHHVVSDSLKPLNVSLEEIGVGSTNAEGTCVLFQKLSRIKERRNASIEKDRVTI